MSRSSLLVCVIFAIIFHTSATPYVSDQLVVTLKHGGTLIGRHMVSQYGRDVRAFLGIPYAKPPVGNLRLSDPEPADAWNGTRLAITDEKTCTGVDVFFQDNVFSGIEDCLYLNVYVPAEPKVKSPLPVMFWIHGGGYIMGSAKSSVYGPQLLMDRDIVLVGINYRVGPLGFMSSETLDMPGNFGLKDQLLALKWVQENIAAFGGNPESVTIFGESAGSASVSYLSIAKRAKGLFHRGIAQSGSPFNPWASPPPKGYAASITKKVLEKVGCAKPTDTTSWTDSIECLRKVDYKTLANIGREFWEFKVLPLPTFPIVVEPEYENAFLSQQLEDVHFSNTVPLIVGFNSEEGLLITKFNNIIYFDESNADFEEHAPILMDYKYAAKEYHPMIKSSIKQYYFPTGLATEQNFTDVLSDAWFISGIDKHIKQRLAAKVPTYVYKFQNKGLTFIYKNYNTFAGTSHADDLFYLFPVNDLFLPTVIPTKRDHELREHFLDLWTNFAIYGNPTPQGSKLPEWSVIDSYPPKMLHIGNNDIEGPLLHSTNDYPKERIEFWESLAPYLVKHFKEIN